MNAKQNIFGHFTPFHGPTKMLTSQTRSGTKSVDASDCREAVYGSQTQRTSLNLCAAVKVRGLHALRLTFPIISRGGRMTIPINTRAFRDVSSLLPASRVRFTCMSVGLRNVALGTTNGTIFLLQKSSGQLVFVNQPDGFAGCEMRRILLAPAENRLAVAFVDQSLPILVLDLESIGAREVPRIVGKVLDHRGSGVTDLSWDREGKILFSSDQEGNVAASVLTGTKLRKSEKIFSETGSSIVQLSSASIGEKSLLIVSTTKRALVLDVSSRETRSVGTKPRDGQFGACFDSSRQFVFASRPGFRMWVADMESGQVLNTLKFVVPNHISENSSTSLEKTSQLGRLYSVESPSFPAALSWDDSALLILDMTNICVAHWVDPSKYGRILGACVFEHEIFLLHELESTRVSVFEVGVDPTETLLSNAESSASLPEASTPEPVENASSAVEKADSPAPSIENMEYGGKLSPSNSSVCLSSVVDADADTKGVDDAGDLGPSVIRNDSVHFIVHSEDSRPTSGRGRTRSRTARTVDLSSAPVLQPVGGFIPVSLDDLRGGSVPDFQESTPEKRKQAAAGRVRNAVKKKKPNTSPTSNVLGSSNPLEPERQTQLPSSAVSSPSSEVVADASKIEIVADLPNENEPSLASQPSRMSEDSAGQHVFPVAVGGEVAISSVSCGRSELDSSIVMHELRKALCDNVVLSDPDLARFVEFGTDSCEVSCLLFQYFLLVAKSEAGAISWLESHVKVVDVLDHLVSIDPVDYPGLMSHLFAKRAVYFPFWSSLLVKNAEEITSELIVLYPRFKPSMVAALVGLLDRSMSCDVSGFSTTIRWFASYLFFLFQRYDNVSLPSGLLNHVVSLCLMGNVQCQLVSVALAQPYRYPIQWSEVLPSVAASGRVDELCGVCSALLMDPVDTWSLMCVAWSKNFAEQLSSSGEDWKVDSLLGCLHECVALSSPSDASVRVISLFNTLGPVLSSSGCVLYDRSVRVLQSVLLTAGQSFGWIAALSSCRSLMFDVSFCWNPMLNQELFRQILEGFASASHHRQSVLKVLESLDGYLWSACDPSFPPHLRMLSELEIGLRAFPAGTAVDPRDIMSRLGAEEVSFWSAEDADCHWGRFVDIPESATLEGGSVVVLRDGKLTFDR